MLLNADYIRAKLRDKAMVMARLMPDIAAAPRCYAKRLIATMLLLLSLLQRCRCRLMIRYADSQLMADRYV